MLQPKRTKYRKVHKGRNDGLSWSANAVSFGEYGLKATAHGQLTARQIEAARRSISRYVKRGGKILVCGATAGFDPKEDLRFIWTFELQVIGSNSFYNEDFSSLMGMIQAGQMKPVIDSVLPLEKAAEGLALIRDRKVMGKVIVTP